MRDWSGYVKGCTPIVLRKRSNKSMGSSINDFVSNIILMVGMVGYCYQWKCNARNQKIKEVIACGHHQ